MIVVLWRGGLRIQEALALAEHDLDPRRGSLLVRNDKGGRHGRVGLGAAAPVADRARRAIVGSLFCVINGPHGRPWSSAAIRSELRRLAVQAGVRRR